MAEGFILRELGELAAKAGRARTTLSAAARGAATRSASSLGSTVQKFRNVVKPAAVQTTSFSTRVPVPLESYAKPKGLPDTFKASGTKAKAPPPPPPTTPKPAPPPPQPGSLTTASSGSTTSVSSLRSKPSLPDFSRPIDSGLSTAREVFANTPSFNAVDPAYMDTLDPSTNVLPTFAYDEYLQPEAMAVDDLPEPKSRGIRSTVRAKLRSTVGEFSDTFYRMFNREPNAKEINQFSKEINGKVKKGKKGGAPPTSLELRPQASTSASTPSTSFASNSIEDNVEPSQTYGEVPPWKEASNKAKKTTSTVKKIKKASSKALDRVLNVKIPGLPRLPKKIRLRGKRAPKAAAADSSIELQNGNSKTASVRGSGSTTAATTAPVQVETSFSIPPSLAPDSTAVFNPNYGVPNASGAGSARGAGNVNDLKKVNRRANIVTRIRSTGSRLADRTRNALADVKVPDSVRNLSRRIGTTVRNARGTAGGVETIPKTIEGSGGGRAPATARSQTNIAESGSTTRSTRRARNSNRRLLEITRGGKKILRTLAPYYGIGVVTGKRN